MEPARTRAPVIPGIEELVEIGRGGAGVVYRGVQTKLARTVAVKVVHASGAPEAALRRWRREVTAMARLSSQPNIVAVLDGGVTDGGLPFLVMPFVTGGSLEGRLATAGPMDAADVVALGRKLAVALAAAHTAGVLHRDVKPANVLLGAEGEPQLADFGIAQLADATATMTVGVHATVAYAAPEVLSGQAASAASDVYGLAATLHACLTGAPPHEVRAGEALVSHALRVVADPPADLRAAGVDPALVDVLERAMAKDPARRTSSATELAFELTGLAGPGSPAAAPVASPTVRLPAPSTPTTSVAVAPAPPAVAPAAVRSAPARAPRRGWLILSLLLVLGVLVALLVLGLLRRDDEPEPAAVPEAAGTAPPTEAPATTATPPVDEDLAGVATGYIEALQRGDFAGAYAMTTAGFQAAQPFDGYVAFWSGFGEISIDGAPRVDAEASTVTLRLRLDGSTESYPLELVATDGGTLLIDGPRPR